MLHKELIKLNLVFDNDNYVCIGVLFLAVRM